MLVLYTIRCNVIFHSSNFKALLERQNVNAMERLVHKAQIHVVSHPVNDEEVKEQEKMDREVETNLLR